MTVERFRQSAGVAFIDRTFEMSSDIDENGKGALRAPLENTQSKGLLDVGTAGTGRGPVGRLRCESAGP
jgi:hypothetical protein